MHTPTVSISLSLRAKGRDPGLTAARLQIACENSLPRTEARAKGARRMQLTCRAAPDAVDMRDIIETDVTTRKWTTHATPGIWSDNSLGATAVSSRDPSNTGLRDLYAKSCHVSQYPLDIL